MNHLASVDVKPNESEVVAQTRFLYLFILVVVVSCQAERRRGRGDVSSEALLP